TAMSSARISPASSTCSTNERWRNTSTATATRPSATVTTSVAATVVRARTVVRRHHQGRSATVGIQPVPDQPDGLDRRPAERLVEFLAQMPDIDLDDVRVAVEGEVPDVVQNGALGEYLAGTAHQELEQRELAGGEADLGVAAPDPVCGRVQPQV